MKEGNWGIGGSGKLDKTFQVGRTLPDAVLTETRGKKKNKNNPS